MKSTKRTIKVDDAVSWLSRLVIQKGEQALVNFQDSDAMLCIVNPDDGRKPYFLYNDDGFEEITGLLKEEDEVGAWELDAWSKESESGHGS
jgi:hypothetical protein